MDELSKKQFHKHKIYRLIALLAKLVAVTIFTFVFARVLIVIDIPLLGKQSLGTFLTTLFSLIVYYGLIFTLNRLYNFKAKTNLKNAIIIYTLVILILLITETLTSGMLQNAIYSLFPYGLKEGAVYPSIFAVNNLGAYFFIGIAVHVLFSFATGLIIFFLYKAVLNRKDIIGKA